MGWSTLILDLENQLQMVFRFVQIFSCVFLLIAFSGIAYGQDKIEREYKIKRDSVPLKAQEFIYDSGFLEKKTKISWYREVGSEKETVEAKFKQNGNQYSIEFFMDGKLQDAEIQIHQNSLPRKSRQNIEAYLDEVFTKWRYQKKQRQWSGENEAVLRALKEDNLIEGVTERFELVISVNSKDEKGYFEFLFDVEGRFLSKAKIIQNSSDILIY